MFGKNTCPVLKASKKTNWGRRVHLVTLKLLIIIELVVWYYKIIQTYAMVGIEYFQLNLILMIKKRAQNLRIPDRAV